MNEAPLPAQRNANWGAWKWPVRENQSGQYEIYLAESIVMPRKVGSPRDFGVPTARLTRPLSQKRYSLGYALISIIYLLTIIIVKAYNLGIADFDQFKTLLVLGETIFAAYIGQIVHAMFSAGSTEAT